jgi:hypothetical protein
MRTALILGAVPLLCCVPASQDSGIQHWRSHSEVYELAIQDNSLFAKTSGGILKLENGNWRDSQSMPEGPPQFDVAAKGDGAFVSATAKHEHKLIASFWGGKHILEINGENATALFPRPPTEGDYALASVAGLLYAGTNRGLYVRAGSDWKRVDLGGELPFARVHGIARSGDRHVIGGIEGVSVGVPGDWKSISSEPVRTVYQSGNDVWIVYGSGAVDKLAADGALHSDVLYGAAKRAWTSSIGSSSDGGVVLGGLGGWVRKGKTFAETYPAGLQGEVTTAILERGDRLLVGTQSKGLVRIANGSELWFNPGTGLSDTWVTAICFDGKDPMVVTATAGLFKIRGNRAEAVACPSQKLRHLAVYKGSLVVGALDGAWIKKGNSWEKLATDSLETTCLTVIGSELWVGTPRGLFRIRR